MSTLILVRHGESVWNAENRFTGWVDSPLSDQGREEAKKGGERLAAEGVRVDDAFTSTLVRGIETGQIVLDALGQGDLAQEQAWELNERFYGFLTGRNKDEARRMFGEEQVHVWRRSFATAPPGGESLKDTTDRALPYFRERIQPLLRDDAVVLISAHGNSLRAIVKQLDGLDDDAVTRLEIPTGVPIVYEMRDDEPVAKRVLE
ncbi:MAG: 2,3-diphosphoglycerate-dependent phosphoglycerate mutase [Actinobacteria bacterium]|nr:2,3-diphosphoglycerate-dependent phosphoglycerate mutase [Actinomycetota bacterium]